MEIKDLIKSINSEDISVEEKEYSLLLLKEQAKKLLQSREDTACISVAIDLKDLITEDTLTECMLKDNSDYPIKSLYKIINKIVGDKLANTAWFEVEIVKN